MVRAVLHEIFSSRQGEGPHAGEPMTFVRFQGCRLRCRWCDTQRSLPHRNATFRVESAPGTGRFTVAPNPIDTGALTAIVRRFPHGTIAVTGGEPLEQAEFLAEWLPQVTATHRILLETDGVRHQALTRVLPFVQIISMDIKLPSSTGMRAYWAEHAAFLGMALAGTAEIYCKIVVTAETSADEIANAAAWLKRAAPRRCLVLQPATPTAGYVSAPTPDQLQAHAARCRALLADVRIIPQMHKQWGIR